jgi:dUTP pyrophosphatase
MRVKIINKSNNLLPKYATKGSAAFDIQAFIPDGYIMIAPFDNVTIPTGLYIQLPEGFELQIRSRSGLARSHKLVVLNSPGTIDSDYREEIGVILMNFSKESYKILSGERIAQAKLSLVIQAEWEEVDKLDLSTRNGGFGSTGK